MNYFQTKKVNELPQTKTNKTYPNGYVITLVSENNKAKLKLKKDAIKLRDHIEIVAESRKLYEDGNVITWEEFVQNESK